MTLTVRAGLLRHRITVERATETINARGEVVQTWNTFAARQASVEPLSGRELFLARQHFATVTHRIRLRHVAGITPKMRVRFGTRVFDIDAVLNLEERSRQLELLATENV